MMMMQSDTLMMSMIISAWHRILLRWHDMDLLNSAILGYHDCALAFEQAPYHYFWCMHCTCSHVVCRVTTDRCWENIHHHASNTIRQTCLMSMSMQVCSSLEGACLSLLTMRLSEMALMRSEKFMTDWLWRWEAEHETSVVTRPRGACPLSSPASAVCVYTVITSLCGGERAEALSMNILMWQREKEREREWHWALTSSSSS